MSEWIHKPSMETAAQRRASLTSWLKKDGRREKPHRLPPQPCSLRLMIPKGKRGEVDVLSATSGNRSRAFAEYPTQGQDDEFCAGVSSLAWETCSSASSLLWHLYHVSLPTPLYVTVIMNMCCAKLLQSCPTLCSPMDYSPPKGSSIHGILQARRLEWVAIPFSRGSSRPRDQTPAPYISPTGRRVLDY